MKLAGEQSGGAVSLLRNDQWDACVRQQWTVIRLAPSDFASSMLTDSWLRPSNSQRVKDGSEYFGMGISRALLDVRELSSQRGARR